MKNKPVLSIVTNVIDDVEKIDFYLILDNEVIASARIVYPREPMPVLMAGCCWSAQGQGLLALVIWRPNNLARAAQPQS